MVFVWIVGIELDFKEVWFKWCECGIIVGLVFGVLLFIGCLVVIGLFGWCGGWIGLVVVLW